MGKGGEGNKEVREGRGKEGKRPQPIYQEWRVRVRFTLYSQPRVMHKGRDIGS